MSWCMELELLGYGWVIMMMNVGEKYIIEEVVHVYA